MQSRSVSPKAILQMLRKYTGACRNLASVCGVKADFYFLTWPIVLADKLIR